MIRKILVRSVARLVAHALFRVQIEGRRQIPSSGPALLVSNHVTHLDGFLIQASLDPVVRFVVWKPIYDHIALHWALRITRAIPVGTGHRSVSDSIRRSRAALRQGDILCIFAEGGISRTGKILPFQRGLEAIQDGNRAPIIPVHLSGLWESPYSFRGGRFLGKWPSHLRHPVTITFGPPLPATSKAKEVQQAVEQL